MGCSLKTHKGKHSFGISFPTFHHPPVLFDGLIKIHGEWSFRAIGRLGIFLRRFRVTTTATYRG
jgi:hypothetical protein